MKKFFLLLSLTLLASTLFGQAKKPKLMIVPARIWCIQNNYTESFTNMSGKVEQIPSYQMAFDNDTNVRAIIAAMQDFFIAQNYEVVDLEAALSKLASRSARDNMTTAGGGLASSPIDELNKSAKADITVDVDFSVKKEGPYKYIEFNVGATDSYTSAPISKGNIGRGTAASSTQIVNQVEEAVLSFKDKFIGDMDRYFEKLFVSGRQIVVRCTLAEASPINYEEEFDGEELGDLLDSWVADNSVNSNYSLDSKTENEVYFDRVFIPMTYEENGKTRGTDANWYGRNLRKYIETVTGGVKCKVDLIGLGEINVIMGGK